MATADGGSGAEERSAARVFQLASDILTDLHRHGLTPTPRHYELWFAYLGGANPTLADRLNAMIAKGEALDVGVLETLQRDFLGSAELDSDAIGESAEGLQVEAQHIAQEVASTEQAFQDYGAILETCAQDLDQQPAIAGLVQVVAKLANETSRAVARNQVLQQKLSASGARIERLRRSLSEVKQEAHTDALTGIANRKAFDARLKRALIQVRAEPHPMSVLLLDIDHFKQFNDLHGHKTGDLVLRLVGRVLRDSVKGRDTAARYGGEEFAILLSGADLPAATVVARQICAALGGKQLVSKDRSRSLGHLTLSAGVAQYAPGDTLPGLVARADQALYAAKRSGRNRVCTEEELDVAA